MKPAPDQVAAERPQLTDAAWNARIRLATLVFVALEHA
jgi:hypothetical protein